MAQQEMANDIAEMDDEALQSFWDGPELVSVKRMLMRGGCTESDVDAADLTKKILERITVHYKELSQLPEFHLMLERAGMAPLTDIALSNEISGKQIKQANKSSAVAAADPPPLAAAADNQDMPFVVCIILARTTHSSKEHHVRYPN